MKKIKVLIIDDSAVVRAILTKIFSQDSEIEVVGTAPDPYIAVEKIKTLEPDVLTLDVEMPRMDGITFLEKLMKSHPMPVIMISTWTSSNSEKGIKALSLGAVDVVEKPKKSENIQELSEEIISKVKCAVECTVKKFKTHVVSLSKSDEFKIQDMQTKTPQPVQGRETVHSKSYQNQLDNKEKRAGETKSNKIILIGASTGGTLAVEDILKGLPAEMPGIVIVQHMPENFTKAFADRLDGICRLNIKEAEDGDIVCSGTVYIAPGGRQCYIKRNLGYYTIKITDDEPVNRHKPSVDALFLSAAEQSCKNIIGVILTGMGKDGAKGMLELRNAGSYNIAQDEQSCVIFGMPKEAIELGAAHEVLRLDKIARRLIELVR